MSWGTNTDFTPVLTGAFNSANRSQMLLVVSVQIECFSYEEADCAQLWMDVWMDKNAIVCNDDATDADEGKYSTDLFTAFRG